jgi:folate-dependent phosphoribosylglycinamide formyltransferase PurN
MTAAVVFAYHNVGCRCLAVLLAHGIDVKLVVTHRDNPGEHIWFDSVAALADSQGIPTITPDDPNAADVTARVRDVRPDLLFSFYYRHMLGADLLGTAKTALNMHGSLLPKYRGRVPVNWAVIRGEHETGASLHHMAIKPDAGDLVDQMAVPILPDDTVGRSTWLQAPISAAASRRTASSTGRVPPPKCTTSSAASPRPTRVLSRASATRARACCARPIVQWPRANPRARCSSTASASSVLAVTARRFPFSIWRWRATA